MVDAGDVVRKDSLAAILAEIEALGPVLSGCIIERSTRCQTKSCHCHAEPPQLHGPYPTWTHREDGRQVTRTITREQADRLRIYIDRDRRLHELIGELERASIAVVEQGEGIRLSRTTKAVGTEPTEGGISFTEPT